MPTPMAVNCGDSMFSRWPAEVSHPAMTSFGVRAPIAMFSPAYAFNGYAQVWTRSIHVRATGGAGSSWAM